MSNHLMTNYAPFNLEPQKGEGVWLTARDGRRFLDMGSGVAVNTFGHCYPPLVEALQEQAQNLWHVSNWYDLPLAKKLAALLCQNSFADRVFFANTGLEAMEGCIKVARRYQQQKSHGKKWRIITFEGAFHGRSFATIAAGNQAKHLEGFGPKMDGFDQVALGDIDALKAMISEQTAAILIEPIQGESGVKPQSAAFLQELRNICDRHDLLLIFDEVQCGTGRTGKLFAYEYSGVVPDIMGLAKGLGSGFPIGAILAKEEIAACMTPGSHGSTFGGNPLATKIGITTLNLLLKDGFLDEVAQKGLDLQNQLKKIAADYPQYIKDVRGCGLMIGMVCKTDAMKLNQELMDAGLLLIPAGDNVLRWLPPLNVTKDEYEQALDILKQILAKRG
ncbi:MAG: aspartate aminotransferase family protein [Alphaproteobacteria bacterium]